jgi:hypothetical protein
MNDSVSYERAALSSTSGSCPLFSPVESIRRKVGGNPSRLVESFAPCDTRFWALLMFFSRTALPVALEVRFRAFRIVKNGPDRDS